MHDQIFLHHSNISYDRTARTDCKMIVFICLHILLRGVIYKFHSCGVEPKSVSPSVVKAVERTIRQPSHNRTYKSYCLFGRIMYDLQYGILQPARTNGSYQSYELLE